MPPFPSFFERVDNVEVLSTHVLGACDIATVVIYLVALAGVTIWVNVKIGGADSEHYFLGGRSVPFWAIGASLFASNLGTDHLVGLAGSGAATGLAVGNYEWSACYTLLLLGWLFVPRYLASEIYTVPEYLEKRFSRRFRSLFTWLTIASTVFTKISVTIFAGCVVMKMVLGLGIWVSSVSLLALTGIYTTIGGLAAVVYTEVLQSLVIGSCALLWFGLEEVGGAQGLRDKLPPSHLTLIKPLSDPDFPWFGVVVGMPICSIWYWCTDQVMVQRVLATNQLHTSQQACVMAGWLKLLPMYLMVLPGLIAAALYPEDVAKDSNEAFPLLVTRLLPAGWQGPMIAVMLSSFMAALASSFNSCSTLFTMDVYASMVPDHTEARLVCVGRLFTVFLAVVSVAWLPVIERSGSQLFLYIQSMQQIWSSPVVVVFLASFASKSISEWVAWWSLVAGLAFGLAFWLVREVFGAHFVAQLNVLHFSIMLFVLDLLLLVVLHTAEPYLFPKGELDPLVKQTEIFSSRLLDKQRPAGVGTKLSAVTLLMVVVGLTIWHSV